MLLLTLFPNSGYEMQTKWEVKHGATVRFPDISSRFAKCCTYLYPHFDMVHLFHPTFPNGGYELQMKWEVNCGATFCFPDISSRFAKCCTYLDPHFDMVHFFHPTFPNVGSYMFTLNASVMDRIEEAKAAPDDYGSDGEYRHHEWSKRLAGIDSVGNTDKHVQVHYDHP